MIPLLKSRLLFTAAAGVSIALVLWYPDPFISYVILYSLLILLGLAAVMALSSPLFIRVRQQAEKDHVFRDQPYRYSTRISNRGPFAYPRLEFHYSDPHLIRYDARGEDDTVPPLRTVSTEHTARFPYRGRYRVGIRSVTVTDFWGLIRCTFPVGQSTTVLVYPACDDDFSLPLKSRLQDKAARPHSFLNNDVTEVSDMRAYRPSDDYRSIHWKLSARRGEWIVKNRQSPVQNRTLLFLDNRSLPLDNEEEAAAVQDGMASLAASAVRYCHGRRVPVTFSWGDPLDNSVGIEPSEDLHAIYRLLAELPFDQEASRLADFCRRPDHGAGLQDLVILLSGLDSAQTQCLEQAAFAGHNVVVYRLTAPGLPLSAEEESLLQVLRDSGASVNTPKLPERPSYADPLEDPEGSAPFANGQPAE